MDLNNLASMGQELEKALHQELALYHRLLSALQDEQEAIISREVDKLTDSARLAASRVVSVRMAHEQRAHLERQVAHAANLAEAETYSELLPLFPQGLQRNLQDLVKRINVKLDQVKQCARQNHLLLQRSIDLSVELAKRLGENPDINLEW